MQQFHTSLSVNSCYWIPYAYQTLAVVYGIINTTSAYDRLVLPRVQSVYSLVPMARNEVNILEKEGRMDLPRAPLVYIMEVVTGNNVNRIAST